MMKMIMISMTMMSMMFTQMTHPMTMGMMLLLQTMMSSMLSGMMSQTFWFSYVLMLVLLGGMMVLFIYITSIASNEMIQLMSKVSMITITLIITSMMINKMYLEESNQEINIMLINNNTTYNLMKLYNNSTHYITIMMASYLFITLIAIIKIINIFKGPLRKMNN